MFHFTVFSTIVCIRRLIKLQMGLKIWIYNLMTHNFEEKVKTDLQLV